jgi:hypothetical protein
MHDVESSGFFIGEPAFVATIMGAVEWELSHGGFRYRLAMDIQSQVADS